MPLFVVATPIGNKKDFGQRAIETLANADLIIGEELKELRQILKAAGVQAKALDQLNEHSRPADIEHFVNEIRFKKVALVSDCGTPGFCDPGAELVDAVYRAGLEVQSIPGPSSLMAFLSICGVRLDRFSFMGFVPAKTENREKFWRDIKSIQLPVIFMETPYRCRKMLDELATFAPQRFCVVGLNLTQEHQRVLRGSGADCAKIEIDNAEPIVLITNMAVSSHHTQQSKTRD